MTKKTPKATPKAPKPTPKPAAKAKPDPKPDAAPKRSHHKIVLPLPIPAEFHADDLPVVEVVAMETCHVEPLAGPVTFTGILAVSETFWFGRRIVSILPDAGCELPDGLKSGQRFQFTGKPDAPEPAPAPAAEPAPQHGIADAAPAPDFAAEPATDADPKGIGHAGGNAG